jgi:hypothetical protein
MTGDFLDVLFRLRSGFTEMIARADPDKGDDLASIQQLEEHVGRINEAINQIIARGYQAPVSDLQDASTKLEALNTELDKARSANERIKSGLAIAAKVIGVVAQAVSALAPA